MYHDLALLRKLEDIHSVDVGLENRQTVTLKNRRWIIVRLGKQTILTPGIVLWILKLNLNLMSFQCVKGSGITTMMLGRYCYLYHQTNRNKFSNEQFMRRRNVLFVTNIIQPPQNRLDMIVVRTSVKSMTKRSVDVINIFGICYWDIAILSDQGYVEESRVRDERKRGRITINVS